MTGFPEISNGKHKKRGWFPPAAFLCLRHRAIMPDTATGTARESSTPLVKE